MSRDGRRLASAGVDGAIDISQPDGTDMRSIGPNPTVAIFTVAFDHAADRLAAGGADGAIRVWNVRDVPPAGGNIAPDTVHLNAHQDGVMSVTFSPNDELVASGGADKAVRMWNSGNLTPIEQWPTATAEDHAATVTSVAFSADGTRLASGSNDMTVRLWDVQGRQRIGDPLVGHQGFVLSVAIIGNEIVSCGNDHALRFWNAVVGQPHTAPLRGGQKGPVTSVAMGRDGRDIASGDVAGTVRLWSAYTGAEIKTMPGQATGVITHVAFNRQTDEVVSGSADGIIRVWNPAADTVGTIDTGRPVTALAVSPDGNLLAYGGIDGQITIRELSTGRQTTLENKDNAVVFDVAFNPGGDRLASGGVAGVVRVWDRNGREVWHANAAAALPRPFSDRLALAVGHPGEVLGVAFSPDGNRLATGSIDWDTDKVAPAVGVIQRWDVKAGNPIGAPVKIGSAVMGLAFSSQSDDAALDRVAAGSFDPYTIELWNAADGEQYVFTGHQAQVVSVAVSHRSALIVSGSVDGTIRIWPNPPTSPPPEALCAKLTTTMSQKHWNDWVSPQIPYREMCPGLPRTVEAN